MRWPCLAMLFLVFVPAGASAQGASGHSVDPLTKITITRRDTADTGPRVPVTIHLERPASLPIGERSRPSPMLTGAVVGFTAAFLISGGACTIIDAGPECLVVGVVWSVPGAVVGAVVGALLE